MIYISYATRGNYEKVMNEYLLPSLKRLYLYYDIKIVENLGTWAKNTNYKAEFIKKMLLKHKQSVIFLDADATIERNPFLFPTLKDYDIAYHELDWDLQYKKNSGKKELLSGTLFLNYNEKVLQLLDEWIKENNSNARWEQQNLKNVLIQNKDIKIYKLPVEYCTVVNYDGKVPDYVKKPVILHHQISRKLRNKV